METLPFCNIVGLQQIMQCEHAAIQRQQEHQCVLTEQILATVKYISHKLEPKGNW